MRSWLRRGLRGWLHTGAALLLASSLPLAPLCEAHPASSERLQHLNQRLEAHPKDAARYVDRAFEYAREARFDEALADLEVARTLAPELARLDYFQAQLLFGAERYQPSLVALSAYLKANPEDGHALLLRARVLSAQDLPLESAKHYGLALRQLERRDRPGPDLYAEQARAYEKAGSAHLPEAIQALEQGMSQLGRLVALDEQALGYERSLKRYDAALRRIETLRQQAQRQERWWIEKAEVLEAQGRLEEALMAYEQAEQAIAKLSESRRKTTLVQQLERRATEGTVRIGARSVETTKKAVGAAAP